MYGLCHQVFINLILNCPLMLHEFLREEIVAKLIFTIEDYIFMEQIFVIGMFLMSTANFWEV